MSKHKKTYVIGSAMNYLLAVQAGAPCKAAVDQHPGGFLFERLTRDLTESRDVDLMRISENEKAPPDRGARLSPSNHGREH